ncbi:MAG: cation-transporting P-type ATPase, partial [Microthrixaceae bacterium]|nr:cation-transporting P-type ATPase [Microthrixaceae bacterium]
ADRDFDVPPGDAPESPAQVGELRLVALVGIVDPVRPTSAAALSAAQEAGIDVRLITDADAPAGEAVGAALGMGSEVIGAAELRALSDEQLAERLSGLRVFGQVDFEDTLRLVRSMQAQGEVVALIGDEPRDAAPLERADLGVVMGSRSTDSHQPARVVLTDDRFETLVHAIELGRSTYAKVAFLLRYQVTQLVALVLLFAAASVLSGNQGVALTPLMVLFLSVVVAAGPAVMISLEPIGEAELRRSPSDASRQLINRFALSRWGLYGAAQFGAAAIPLLFEWKVDASSPGTTVAFVVMAFGTLLGGLAMRREPGSGFGIPVYQALGVLAVPAMFTVFAVELQFLRELLGTNDLAGGEWFVALVLAFGLPMVVEIDQVFRRRPKTTGPTKSGRDASPKPTRANGGERPARPKVGPKTAVRVEREAGAEVARSASSTASDTSRWSWDGLALVAGPLIVAAFFWARGASPVRYMPLLVLSVALLVASLVVPGLIERLVSVVRSGAERLGDAVMHLIAYLVMALGIVPLHVLSRLVRHDPLETGWPSERSAFIRIDPARSRNPDGTVLDSPSGAARETPLAPSARRRSRARVGVVATIMLAAVGVVVL